MSVERVEMPFILTRSIPPRSLLPATSAPRQGRPRPCPFPPPPPPFNRRFLLASPSPRSPRVPPLSPPTSLPSPPLLSPLGSSLPILCQDLGIREKPACGDSMAPVGRPADRVLLALNLKAQNDSVAAKASDSATEVLKLALSSAS